jgi:hypothetical protein
VRHDPRAALAVLKRHRREFAEGVLGLEASSLLVDALLANGEQARALLELDALNLDAMPRSLELHVVRGELRAARHRCIEAEPDLSAALAVAGGPLRDRAARARASCRR